MEDSLKQYRRKINSIKTTRKWVDFLLELDITQQKKGHLTKIWLQKHGYTGQDLQEARKQSKFWREKTRINARNRRQIIEENAINTGKKWTAAEVRKLKQNIDKPEKELVKIFKRSLQSINARKRLIRMEQEGISTENTGKPWSKKELNFLMNNFSTPAFELARTLKRTVKSIQRQKDRIQEKKS